MSEEVKNTDASATTQETVKPDSVQTVTNEVTTPDSQTEEHKVTAAGDEDAEPTELEKKIIRQVEVRVVKSC